MNPPPQAGLSQHQVLVCRVGAIRCGLPLEAVEETMRPLPVRPLGGVPAFVRGLAVVRGEATPVVDAAMLLGGEPSSATRFVTVKAGSRRVVLAVGAVSGVAIVPAAGALPPLLARAAGEAIQALGVLDAELLLVLRSAQLIPDDAWASVAVGGEE